MAGLKDAAQVAHESALSTVVGDRAAEYLTIRYSLWKRGIWFFDYLIRSRLYSSVAS